MLAINPAVPIYLHAEPIDMRKSFDGLFGIVLQISLNQFFKVLSILSSACVIFEKGIPVLWEQHLLTRDPFDFIVLVTLWWPG